MKRRVLSLALALLLANSGTATATSSNISPHSQSRAHGQASSWLATWGDNSPYNYVFHPDVANPGLHEKAEYGVTKTSYPHSMAWWPCTSTLYTQQLVIDDRYGSANHWSTASEAGGNPCAAPLP